jgi:hypothetical protein
MATREDFVNKFKTVSEASTFEDRVLDTETLPDCAVSVTKGHEPTSEYWDFLLERFSDSEETLMFQINSD